MSVTEYIRALLASPRFGAQVTYHRVVPPEAATYAATRLPWPPAIRTALKERGISQLYTHQALATDSIRAGYSIVAATPTASGKSLIYNLPVLETLLRDPDAHALYLFPLKALAQDQAAAFQALTMAWPASARPSVAVYDGDSSAYMRRKLRQNPPSVLITNPEMLHLALLPYHEQWAMFFAGLTHVVVDEAHTYRGIFGAHMAQVFRRMQRVTARYTTKPVHILCTATVGNPGELAAALLGTRLPVEDTAAAQENLTAELAQPSYGWGNAPTPVVITRSGAPQGARHFVFINPEDSPATMAIALLKAALARELRSIVYCRSRRMTELIALWAAEKAGRYAGRISAYRAGFLPEERRAVEARMASGELLAVITTSALELGIDIGTLDVCILVGYPGTVMSTLQRGGRVGRKQRDAAVLLVAGEDALDQYIVRNAPEFFSRPAECAVINPDNATILRRHIECAAAELPLHSTEAWLHRPAVQACIADLLQEGKLLLTADGTQYLAARKRPQRHVDLRGCGERYTIEDATGAIIGTVEGFRAYSETHLGAVYLHHGITYVVTEFDPSRALVRVRRERVSWFTRARSRKSTEILRVDESTRVGSSCIFRGALRITETISGYEKRTVAGNRLLTVIPLDLPPHIFETEGIWIVIPDTLRREMEEHYLHFMGAIHAVEHATIGIIPLLVMADRNDFGGISIPLHPQIGLPAIFVYDALPGGAGLSKAAFSMAKRLLEATLRVVTECPCEDGCPSCVHSPKCGSGNRPISKLGARILLQKLLGTDHALQPDEVLAAMHAAPSHEDNSVYPQDTSTGTFVPKLVLSQASSSDASEIHDAVPVAPPRRYMVLDVETRRSAAEVGGWHRADRMGVSIAVLYDAGDDLYHVYQQDELPEMFARMALADLVVGFNTLRFDYKVLQPFHNAALRDLPSLDLLERIIERLSYRVSLDNLGQATFEESKSADGLQALRWWQEGQLEKIAAYCRKDVELTRRLYLHGLEHGTVLFRNKAEQKVRIPVDFRQR